MALFRRRRQQIEMSEAALRRRSQNDLIEDGLIVNGCVEFDDYDEALCESMGADTISMSGWERGGDMPIFAWDAEFEKYLKQRQELLARVNAAGYSWLPWDVLAHLPIQFKKSNKFAFSQGGRPTCSGHSAAFASNMSTLINLALGQAHLYNPANPTAAWLWSKKGSYKGGQCLTFDQRVYTSVGAKKAGELALSGEEFVILSYSRRLGRVAAKKAYATYSGVKECVRVTTDKGVFELSCDHPMMLKTGEFVHAVNLKVGQSLFQVSTSKHTDGYIRVGLHDRKKGKAYMHQLVLGDVMGFDLSDGVVHHKDENRLNNLEENLEIVSRAEHFLGHVGSTKRSSTVLKMWHRVATDSDFAETYRQNRLLRSKQKQLDAAYKIINLGYDISTEGKYRAAIAKVTGKSSKTDSFAARLKRICKNFGSYDNFVSELAENNHRVVSVEPVGIKPVYMISVLDPEPDDKRQWSEHNYAIVPEGVDSYFMNGVLVANSIMAVSNAVNVIGNFPMSVIGENNITVPKDYMDYHEEAAKHQSGICFMPLDNMVDRVVEVCKSGLALFLGNTTKVADKCAGKNGMRIATLSGKWNHSTSIGGYVFDGGEDYVFFLNSHGPRYKGADKYNAPSDGVWMNKQILTQFLSTAARYKHPAIIIPETPVVQWDSFEPIVKAPLVL